MNSKFQVGDMVIAPRLFNGVLKVNQIMHDTSYPVIVEDGDFEFSFTIDGRETEIDLQPSLFHAGTEITVKETVPVRDLAWPWVNVYTDEHGKLYSGESHPTREEAIMNISKSWSYLCTTQLTLPKKNAAE